ncbi:DNA helicase [Candidatus Kaiserbacteria bacterium]|nr:DNA helicase [Candidatus Kaiserbacteria bacterium]
MTHRTTPHFDRAFLKLSPEIQNAFEKQVRLLAANIRHPSLRAKKYDETHDIWQARVTKNVRFYFSIVGDAYIILDIVKHKD